MITVILATLNGARTLGRTLDALGRAEPPSVPWRLIVVDNGSTDGTPRLLEAYRGALPMTILRETGRGKSKALNLALRSVRVGLVVFTDDDIVPDADWLRSFETVAASRPDHALFAGRIRPLWEAAPPAWLAECVDLDACYGIHLERPEGPCPPHLLYGGNMAIRAEAIGVERFDESYGPFDAPQFAMCGETEFVCRLAAAGSRSWFCRDAVVRHTIPAEHLQPDWLLNRAGNFGRGQCRLGRDPLLSSGVGWRMQASLRAAIATSRLRGLAARLRRDSVGAFRAQWRLSYLEGLAAEHQTASRRTAAAAPTESMPRDAGSDGRRSRGLHLADPRTQP